jgi:RimJ/RimL family protein N-acetyltransferase
MALISKNIILNKFKPKDAQQLSIIANNKKIWLNVRDRFPHPYNLSDAESFIKIATKENPNNKIFAIRYKNKLAGSTGIFNGDDVYKNTFEIGYWLGEEYWGKGIASKAVELITDYAFITLGARKVWAGCFAYNEGSMKVLLKNNFTQEGLLKDAIIKDGKVGDEYRFGKLNPR